MYYIPSLTALHEEGIAGAIFRFVSVVLLLFLFGPVWLAGSIFVYFILERDGYLKRLWLVALGIAGVVWLSILSPFLSAQYRTFLDGDGSSSFLALALAWGSVLPSMPAGGFVLKVLDVLVRLFRPDTAVETVRKELHRAERVSKAQTTYAIQQTAHPPKTPLLLLGPCSYSEPFDQETGVQLVSNWIAFEERVLDEHMFILGGTGAGKTGTIKQLVSEILAKTNRDVYLIDGKGEEKLAQWVRACAYQGKRGNAPIFRLGKRLYGAQYDGFRGDPNALWNRLCAMIGIPEAKGDSEYYASINRDILQLVCYAPNGPPRDFRELRERITLDWLLDTYLHDPEEGPLVQSLDEDRINDLATRFRPLEREFRSIITRNGFALEDTRCFIFSIRTQAALDSGKQFLKFFVDDVRDFVGNRQERPGVIVIDEFAQFGNENIVNLLSLARSSNLSIILATQDISMLGDPSLQQQIMANCMTDILMRTKYPEAITMLAGTRKQVEVATQIVEGAPSGVQTVRPQDAFRVPPEEAAKLANGGAFVIRRRTGAKVQVRKVGDDTASILPPEQLVRVQEDDDTEHKQEL